MVTGLWAGRPKNRAWDCQQEQEICLFSKTSRLTLGPTQPPIQWVPEALSLGGIKRPGAWNWPLNPSTVEFKNEWSCTFTPLYDLMRCTGTAYGLKHVAAINMSLLLRPPMCLAGEQLHTWPYYIALKATFVSKYRNKRLLSVVAPALCVCS